MRLGCTAFHSRKFSVAKRSNSDVVFPLSEKREVMVQSQFFLFFLSTVTVL